MMTKNLNSCREIQEKKLLPVLFIHLSSINSSSNVANKLVKNKAGARGFSHGACLAQSQGTK